MWALWPQIQWLKFSLHLPHLQFLNKMSFIYYCQPNSIFFLPSTWASLLVCWYTLNSRPAGIIKTPQHPTPSSIFAFGVASEASKNANDIWPQQTRFSVHDKSERGCCTRGITPKHSCSGGGVARVHTHVTGLQSGQQSCVEISN